MSLSVAVAGASGYAGGELLRLLAAASGFRGHHGHRVSRTPASRSSPSSPHLRSLAHLTLQETTPEVLSGADVVFLALPHGTSGAITAAASG